MSSTLSELRCSKDRAAEWTRSSFIRMTIVIGVRDDSKRVVRVGDGYDVVTSFHPVQQDLFRHREEFSLLL